MSAPVAQRGQQNSVAVARQRLVEVREAVGTGHPEYASALIQLALLLIMHGDPTEAEPLLREALGIRRVTLGERHPDYATCLSSLAGLLWARGDLDAAEPLLRQALMIRCEVLGERHPKSIVSQNSLDQLLQAKKAWDSAAHLETSHQAAAAAPTPAAEVRAEPQPEVPAAPAEAAMEPAQQEPIEPEPEPAPVAAAEPEPQPASTPVEPEPAAAAEPARADAPAAEPQPMAAEVRSREELTRAVEELGALFGTVGGELHGAVGRLRDEGTLPGGDLIEALRDSHDRFAALRGEIVQAAHGLGMADADARPTSNLHDLSELLAELERYELERSRSGQARRQALAVLERVATLQTVDRKEFPPLRECQDAARGLYQAIDAARAADLPPEAFALADGTHAYNALLALADPDAGLNDEAWANALELVQTALGKPMSVAVARAKIVAGAAA